MKKKLWLYAYKRAGGFWTQTHWFFESDEEFKEQFNVDAFRKIESSMIEVEE